VSRQSQRAAAARWPRHAGHDPLVSPRSRDLLTLLRTALIHWPLTVLCTTLLEPISLAASLLDKTGRASHRIVRFWSGVLLRLYGMPVKVTGLERLDFSRPCIYAANHLSALDIPVVYRYLPFQFRIIVHRLVFRVPLVGWHLRASRQLMIDPESVALSRRALREAIRTLRGGMSMVIFPEGERSPTGEMLPFRPGAFYAAVEAQVDIVPMAIRGTYEAFPRGSAIMRPCPLQLIVGEPIPIAGYTRADLKTLAKRTQEAVAELGRQAEEEKHLAIGN
jgi:1-acyl-sn-glycerol-3-phosphate acyltransferase